MRMSNNGGLIGTHYYTDPSLFSREYIARLGLQHYASFVAAWASTVFSANAHPSSVKFSDQGLEDLACAFECKLGKWKV